MVHGKSSWRKCSYPFCMMPLVCDSIHRRTMYLTAKCTVTVHPIVGFNLSTVSDGWYRSLFLHCMWFYLQMRKATQYCSVPSPSSRGRLLTTGSVFYTPHLPQVPVSLKGQMLWVYILLIHAIHMNRLYYGYLITEPCWHVLVICHASVMLLLTPHMVFSNF